MRAKIDARLKNLVVRLAKSNKGLGVRLLAKLIKEKHGIALSKSAVQNIFKQGHIKQSRGRKTYLSRYQRKDIVPCGFLLLKAIDSQVGLFDLLTDQLRMYFARMQPALLKKIIMLVTFSSYQGLTTKVSAREPGFLRITDLRSYPARKVKFFLSRIADYKPLVTVEKIKPLLEPVSTVKFYFGNNTVGYTDANFSTIWDSPCRISHFFQPYYYVLSRLSAMLRDQTLILYYTQSFNYLSPLVVSFIDGLATGITKVELLGPSGAVIHQENHAIPKLSFLIGYYPKIIAKGMTFLEKEQHFKKVEGFWQDLSYAYILTRFSQPKGNKGIITNSILVKTIKKSLPSWAVLTDKRTNIAALLKRYLLLWPYREKTFLEDMKIIERSYVFEESKKDTQLPALTSLTLEKESDFLHIAELLAALFSARVAQAKFKELSGEYVTGKESCRLVITSPPAFKEKFNMNCFFLGGKRVILL
ncbi:MAG: helix-turn-helix domain-containing protein [Candidatus Omnitrophota bacterium]